MNQLKETTASIRIPIELKTLVKFYSEKLKVTQAEFIRNSIKNQILKSQSV